jgi:hypothetical protein
MRMEWMRAGDDTPAAWACFVIYDDHVEVLAVIGPNTNKRIDRRPQRRDYKARIDALSFLGVQLQLSKQRVKNL